MISVYLAVKLEKRQIERFPLISGYCLDNQQFSYTCTNAQQILTYSSYIFKSFKNPFFRSKIPWGYPTDWRLKVWSLFKFSWLWNNTEGCMSWNEKQKTQKMALCLPQNWHCTKILKNNQILLHEGCFEFCWSSYLSHSFNIYKPKLSSLKSTTVCKYFIWKAIWYAWNIETLW